MFDRTALKSKTTAPPSASVFNQPSRPWGDDEQHVEVVSGAQVPGWSLATIPPQATLEVGQADDEYEREADRVAEQVMRMPETGYPAARGDGLAETVRRAGPLHLQRKVSSPKEAVESTEASSMSAADGEKVLKAGEGWIGAPYVRGGADKKKGVDCSHFVHCAYQDAGFEYEYLDTASFAQSSRFTPVIGPPRTGDVVLFAEHMGMHNSSPPKSGWTVLSARSGHGSVQYGKPEWFTGTARYFRYVVTVSSEKPAGSDKPVIRRRASPVNHTARPLRLQSELAAGSHPWLGEGRPLGTAERAFFEPRFGRDFSEVRIHTDSRGVGAAEAINVRAFTVGRNIAFGSGEYAMSRESGGKLLAHELTHVIQQSSTDEVPRLQRQTKPKPATFKYQWSTPLASQLAVKTPVFTVGYTPLPDTLSCGQPDEAVPIIKYICGEMTKNATGKAVADIRALNSASVEECVNEWSKGPLMLRLVGPGPEECPSRVLGMHVAAMAAWGVKVRSGGDWDHKKTIATGFVRRDLKASGLKEQHYHRLGQQYGYYYDVWSNLHYGYVGAAAGFSKHGLLAGAGAEQFVQDLTRWALPKASGGVSGLKKFDHPSDRAAIAFGFGLWPAKPSAEKVGAWVIATDELTRKPVDPECLK